jgi:hypothetical protein
MPSAVSYETESILTGYNYYSNISGTIIDRPWTLCKERYCPVDINIRSTKLLFKYAWNTGLQLEF